MPTNEQPRTMNLIWLPTAGGAMTTMCRGAVLTVEQRGTNQWAWAVSVGGTAVSEGVSPTKDHVQAAAIEVAVELSGTPPKP